MQSERMNNPTAKAFEVLFAHAAWCTGEVRRAIEGLLPLADSSTCSAGDARNRAVISLLQDWGETLAKMLRTSGEGVWVLERGFPTRKPCGSVQAAAERFDAFSDEQSGALAAIVSDGLTQWSILRQLTEDVFVDLESEQTVALELAGRAAHDQLLGLHCLLGGDPPEGAGEFFNWLACDLVARTLSDANPGGPGREGSPHALFMTGTMTRQ